MIPPGRKGPLMESAYNKALFTVQRLSPLTLAGAAIIPATVAQNPRLGPAAVEKPVEILGIASPISPSGISFPKRAFRFCSRHVRIGRIRRLMLRSTCQASHRLFDVVNRANSSAGRRTRSRIRPTPHPGGKPKSHSFAQRGAESPRGLVPLEGAGWCPKRANSPCSGPPRGLCERIKGLRPN